MKILLVNKFHYLRGGAEKYYLELGRLLESAGHEVAFFSMRHPKNLPTPWEKYFVSRISFNEATWRDKLLAPFRICYSFEARRKFSKLLDDFRPDLIHIHNIYHQISPSILPPAKKRGIPIVMHLHDYKLFCPNYQLFTKNQVCYRCLGGKYYNCSKYRCFKNSAAKSLLATFEMYLHHRILKIYEKNIDLLVAPSMFMKDIALKFGWPAEKIEVVYNFTDSVVDNTSSAQKPENYLLFFGRLSYEKGIHVLLEALKKLPAEHLKIVGTGPEEGKLKQLIKDFGITKQVEMLGPKYGAELNDLINASKAVLFPSVWLENMPLALLESLSRGKVIIASKIGGMPEVITDQINGLLAYPQHPDSLIHQIEALKTIDTAKISQQASLSSKRFLPLPHLEKIISLYTNLLAKIKPKTLK